MCISADRSGMGRERITPPFAFSAFALQYPYLPFHYFKIHISALPGVAHHNILTHPLKSKSVACVLEIKGIPGDFRFCKTGCEPVRLSLRSHSRVRQGRIISGFCLRAISLRNQREPRSIFPLQS